MAYVPTSHTHPPAADVSIIVDPETPSTDKATATAAAVEPTKEDAAQLLNPRPADISIVVEPGTPSTDKAIVTAATAVVEHAKEDAAQPLNPRQAADERPDGKGTFFGAGGAMYDISNELLLLYL